MSCKINFFIDFFYLSPSGKLVQIEYALAAVAAGGPSVGIKGTVYAIWDI
jgi:20S proteasome subunit alpha 2